MQEVPKGTLSVSGSGRPSTRTMTVAQRAPATTKPPPNCVAEPLPVTLDVLRVGTRLKGHGSIALRYSRRNATNRQAPIQEGDVPPIAHRNRQCRRRTVLNYGHDLDRSIRESPAFNRSEPLRTKPRKRLDRQRERTRRQLRGAEALPV